MHLNSARVNECDHVCPRELSDKAGHDLHGCLLHVAPFTCSVPNIVPMYMLDGTKAMLCIAMTTNSSSSELF